MQDISRRAVILGAAALTAGCAAQGTSRMAAPGSASRAVVDTGAIDQVLRQAVGPSKVAGLVATAANDGGTFYEAAYGKRSLDGQTDMTPDSVFWIASMTKPVTCAAAMQMVERGRLSLDGPINDVLPELGSPRVLTGFDASGQPRYRPARRPVTLRHLLTHQGHAVLPGRPEPTLPSAGTRNLR
jgi:methyl acetate hydrolase